MDSSRPSSCPMVPFVLRGVFLILGSASHCHANKQAVSVHPAIASGSDGAFVDCPCKQIHSVTVASLNFSPVGNYGSFCRAWDLSSNRYPPCRALDPPRYCSRPWCWVDARHCKRAFNASVLLEDEHFSYQTCGSLDLFSTSQLHEPDGGFFNGLIYNGVGVWQPDDTPFYWKVVARYNRVLLTHMGLDPDRIHHRHVTNASRRLYPNSIFTALAHDIALGHVDFGLYDFWQTAQRTDFGCVPFTLYSDLFFFWTPRVLSEEAPLWEKLYKPFEPFSVDLWWMIFSTVLFVVVNLACVEYGIEFTFRKPTIIATVLYDTLIGLFSAALMARYKRPLSRMIALAFSIFVVVIIASFTGNTTSFLVKRSNALDITFDQALQRGDAICYYDVVQTALLEIYPGLSGSGVAVPWRTSSMLENIHEGICKHAIAPLYEQSDQISCSFTRTGDPILSVPVGPYVQRQLGNAFMFHNARLREMGVWGSFETTMWPQYACPQLEEEQEDEESMQLTSMHLLGVHLLVIAISLLSMILHLIRVGVTKRSSADTGTAQRNKSVVIRSSLRTFQNFRENTMDTIVPDGVEEKHNAANDASSQSTFSEDTEATMEEKQNAANCALCKMDLEQSVLDLKSQIEELQKTLKNLQNLPKELVDGFEFSKTQVQNRRGLEIVCLTSPAQHNKESQTIGSDGLDCTPVAQLDADHLTLLRDLKEELSKARAQNRNERTSWWFSSCS